MYGLVQKIFLTINCSCFFDTIPVYFEDTFIGDRSYRLV